MILEIDLLITNAEMVWRNCDLNAIFGSQTSYISAYDFHKHWMLQTYNSAEIATVGQAPMLPFLGKVFELPYFSSQLKYHKDY